MIEAVCELLSDWKTKHKPVRTIRCDNAKENNALEKRSKCAVWQLGLTFQYTSSNTPQMNSLVEKFFDTIYNRARAHTYLCKHTKTRETHRLQASFPTSDSPF